MKNKKLNILLGLCVLLLLGVMYYLLVWPKIVELQDSAREAERAKSEAQAKLKEARSLDPEEIDEKLSLLRARVPSSLELPNLIFRLDELAKSSNLQWTQGNPEDITVRATQNQSAQSETEAPDLLEKYDLSIVVSGNINDLNKFIQGMTDISIGRVVVINSLDLQFSATEDPLGVEASFKLEVIGWKDGASLTTQGCIEGDNNKLGSSDQGDDRC